MKISEIAGTQQIAGYFPGHATAGSDKLVGIGKAPCAGTVTAVYWVPGAAVTGANTNNFSLSVINMGSAGAGTGLVATLEFASGTDAEEGVPLAITLDAALTLAAGDYIEVEKAANGTGLACPDGWVIVEFKSLGD